MNADLEMIRGYQFDVEKAIGDIRSIANTGRRIENETLREKALAAMKALEELNDLLDILEEEREAL